MSVVPLQLQSVLMSMDPIIIKGCADARGLGQHLRPCWYVRVMQLLEPYRSECPVLPLGAMVIPGTELQPRAMSASMALL